MSWNRNNPAVKRIMQEMKELREDASAGFIAEALETDIFEWHFVMRGPSDSEFEGGIYHGRILLPADYPFKPPAFMMLTPNGRFETGMKICLSISSHHPEHWQPSWSVRTALTAMIAFMPSPGQGALGSLDFSKDERRKLAARSRTHVPQHGSAERQQVINQMHARMVALDADQASITGVTSAATTATAEPTSMAASDGHSSALSQPDFRGQMLPPMAGSPPFTPASTPHSTMAMSQSQQDIAVVPLPAAMTPSSLPAVENAAQGSTSRGSGALPAAVHESSSNPPLHVAPLTPIIAAQHPVVGHLPLQVTEVSSVGDRGLNMLVVALLLGIAAILCRKVLAVVGLPWAMDFSI